MLYMHLEWKGEGLGLEREFRCCVNVCSWNGKGVLFTKKLDGNRLILNQNYNSMTE